MKWAAFVALAAGLTSACASAQAKAPADRPVLEVPPPPPRTIEPMPEPESPNPEPVGELPPSSSPAPASKPRPAPARETPRTEAKPPETPPTEAVPPATAPAPIAPAPQLRTPSTVDGPEAAKQVQEMIDGAKRALSNVNWQRLNNAQREQYNTAKLLIAKAEEQLKGSNFDIARNNAEKATRIATELQGR